ncbi:MAG: TetR family transcriptional regulator [Actinomycetia bacterium]|nr:TetR family transcriptional regulator [Actinomycetes bacterium]
MKLVLNCVVVELAPDGRVLRGERNREAIADALLSLYEDGVLRPSVQQLAERAGISTRSVHNHFVDMESLRAEVADQQWERHAHLAEPPAAERPLPQRIERLVQRRAAFYETVTPVRRAALLSVHESPTIARRLARLARLLRGQLETLFAAELARGGDELLDALDVCTSWDAWDRLRTQQRLSVPATRRVLVAMLRALFENQLDERERR